MRSRKVQKTVEFNENVYLLFLQEQSIFGKYNIISTNYKILFNPVIDQQNELSCEETQSYDALV